jgi:hypothetical protein
VAPLRGAEGVAAAVGTGGGGARDGRREGGRDGRRKCARRAQRTGCGRLRRATAETTAGGGDGQKTGRGGGDALTLTLIQPALIPCYLWRR